jgi:hypothetical protein
MKKKTPCYSKEAIVIINRVGVQSQKKLNPDAHVMMSVLESVLKIAKDSWSSTLTPKNTNDAKR